MPVPLDIDTERLTLRVPRLEDFPDTFAMWSAPAVTRYIGGKPATEEDAWQRLMRYAGQWSLLGYGFWTLREKGTDRHVGEVGFINGRRAIEPPFGDAPEVGWALVPGAHGKGLATEAVRAVLAWGESHFGRERRTVCMIHPENQASIRVARKCGFREYARTTYKGDPTILYERQASAGAST